MSAKNALDGAGEPLAEAAPEARAAGAEGAREGPRPPDRGLGGGRGSPVYRAGRGTSYWWMHLVHRLRVEHGERIPETGGLLIAANHQSFLDIPALAASTRRHIAFVARRSLTENRFMGWLLGHAEAVLVDRGRPDRPALRKMVRRLQGGGLVAVFPEGTRSRDGRLGPFRRGALVAARIAGVPVLPAGIRGSNAALSPADRVPRPWKTVAIRFGEPMSADAPDAIDTLKARIQEMIGGGRFDSVPPV